MAFLLVCALKDFRRRMTDPAAILTWLGIPLIIGSLLSLVMGGGTGITPRAKLLLVDLDESFLSQLLAGAGSQGGADSMVEIIPVGLEEGRERINGGEGSALLVIPEGFGQALMEETPIQLTLITNPSQRILPKILEEGLEMMVEVAFYAQRLFGEQLRGLAEGPPEDANFFSNAVIAAKAAAMNDRMQAMEGTLFPPLLELEVEVIEKPQKKPVGGMGMVLFPSMLFLSMLFIAQGMSSDIWEEKSAGTLRRVLTTPQSLYVFLLGKILAAAMIVALVTACGLLAGALLFDFPLSGFLPALLWGTLAGMALMTLFLWVQSLGSSQQAASVLSSVVLFPLMMMGGSLFPMEALPDWIVTVGRWTPNGLALIQFKHLLQGNAELGPLSLDFMYLVVFAGLFFVLVVRRASNQFVGS